MLAVAGLHLGLNLAALLVHLTEILLVMGSEWNFWAPEDRRRRQAYYQSVAERQPSRTAWLMSSPKPALAGVS